MIIASRSLEAHLPNGISTVKINVYSPEKSGSTSICRYTIGWPEGERQSYAAGVDSMQAIHFTLQKIGLEIYASAYHKSSMLIWEKPGQGYGFPIPRDGRDLLVGEDKIFEG